MGSKDREMMITSNPELMLRGQAEILEHIFSIVDIMALKSAVELRIADIIHSHHSPITLSQILSAIPNTTSPNIDYLARIMRFLVRRNIFTLHPPSNSAGDTRYGLSYKSIWLLHMTQYNLSPLLLMQNNPLLITPWHFLSQGVKEGGVIFKKAHGVDIWELASRHPELNKIFNDGMACMAVIHLEPILLGYKDGFDNIGSLVDVGGGTGGLIYEIVKSHPHIKAINFDLPHVISTAPIYDGVTHIGGNMFEVIPNADAIVLKSVLHDWNDEDCERILRNCKKSIPSKTGKLIIIDVVLPIEGDDIFANVKFMIDLVMMANTVGGKERTEVEWKQILEKGGFSVFKVINLPSTIHSVIEAYHD